jgi:flagellar motility protein MotE (MotC chaperone)
MKLFIFFIILLISTNFLYGENISKDLIKIDDLDSNEDFFNNLQEIRSELEEKDQKIERKKVEMEELKKEVHKREKELKNYEKNIDENIKSFSTKKSETFKLRVSKLVKVFESMKPKNVAKIVENLPDDLVIAVFLKLKEDNIGLIMKYLDAKKSCNFK